MIRNEERKGKERKGMTHFLTLLLIINGSNYNTNIVTLLAYTM